MRIYLDACLVIYLIERNAEFFPSVENALLQSVEDEICISPLVQLECLIHPLRHGDQHLEQLYRDFFEGVTSLPIPEEVFPKATLLRAHHSLKTPDALHLATAIHHACDEFWTNDDRLSKAAGSMSVNKLKP